MSNNTKATTFWNFLTENNVEIPIIQRDYAQGRLGKENLRKNFLADLKNALDSDGTMKLDFVYGSIENDNLNPLDGQQRLTTLWLLHWYIALRAGKLIDDNCAIFRKFSYETRISSREFCQHLCIPHNFENFAGNDIVGFITKQTWFYSAWKQDPTIQSMLRMLGGTKIFDKKGEVIVDGIEEIFQGANEDGFKSYWEKLTQKETIVFYHLPLKDFGLSDDLYIKMNARGKQLTSFENFKADLIGYIIKQAEDNPESEWKDLLDAENGIPIKLDTEWTDIFWKNRSIGITDKESEKRKSDQIDEIYFVFLNRFFWNELFIGKKANNSEVHILDIGKGDESSTQENNNSSYKYLNNSEHNNDATIAYEGLDVYRYDNGTIPLLFFRKIKRVLDNYFTYSKCNCLPECPWETSFRFIPIYEVKDGSNIEITNNTNDKILSVSTLNQVQRIVFFAVCKYFDHDDKVKDDKTSLKQWMRVVWNLVSGEDQNGRPEIRSTYAMRTAIEFINLLDPHNVYNSLVKKNVSGTTSFDGRCKEEIAKAKQIINGGGEWESKIIEAEKYAFFKGSIRFLFTDCVGSVTEDSWKQFDTKWKNAQKYFDDNGVKDDEESKYKTNAILLKAVLYHVEDFWTYIEPEKFVLDNTASTWKNNILLEHGWEKSVHEILKGNLSVEERSKDCLMYKNLYKTDLLDYVANYQTGSRIRWHHGHRTIYPPRYDGIMLDDENRDVQFFRNRILSTTSNVSSEQKIEGKAFFKGWDINFKYAKDDKSFAFQWNTDGNVYLIENNNRKEKENGSFYWFQADGIGDSEEFTNKLICLIAQAFPDVYKSVCDNCQDKICESASEQ